MKDEREINVTIISTVCSYGCYLYYLVLLFCIFDDALNWTNMRDYNIFDFEHNFAEKAFFLIVNIILIIIAELWITSEN